MNVYEARHAGRTYCCDTEGSDHYKEGGVEPIDLLIAKGLIEDFCIGNMIKYATRFKTTRNLVDLKKVSDYSHILCGVELAKPEAVIPTPPTQNRPTQADLEDLFTEPSEPVKGKYDGLSDKELYYAFCTNTHGACQQCLLPNFLGVGDRYFSEGCTEWKDDHPEEFRKIAIEWLNKQDELEGKA